jgi:threonine dehydrogenase-like Zn-dependent dehydrogenase
MQALFLDNSSVIFLNDYPKPSVGKEQAIIRVIYAGICSTDLELVKGYAGFRGVPGHEFVGVIEQAEDNNRIGQRVVGEINLGCGACTVCLGHGSAHCPQRTVLGIIEKDGAFADYLTMPIENLYQVPGTIEDRVAVFTEPLAAALRIREQVIVPPSEPIAVVGPGKLGLLIGQVMALTGTDVIMLGRRPESLDFAEALGLKADLVDAVENNSFGFVIEATGNEAGLANSLRIVKPQGTLVMKSTFSGLANVDLTKLVVGELRVIGSRCGPFEPALRLLSRGVIEVASMIEAEYSLEDGVKAFEHAARPGARKILLKP